MSQLLGLLSGIISICCYLPYIRDILRGTTKPERASWFIWMVLGSIAFSSQLAKGATASLWMTGIQTLGVAVTFFLSLKFGVGGFVKRDIIALSFAICGLVLWYLTKEAAIALYIVICIDAIGVLLTVGKAYKDPKSETLSTWILAGISALVAGLAVGRVDIVLLSYPIYIVLANCATVTAILLGRRAIVSSR